MTTSLDLTLPERCDACGRGHMSKPRYRRGKLSQKCLTCGRKMVSGPIHTPKPRKAPALAAIEGRGIDTAALKAAGFKRTPAPIRFAKKVFWKSFRIAGLVGTGAFIDHRWGDSFAEWVGVSAKQIALFCGAVLG